MEHKRLLRNLKQLGYALFDSGENIDANVTLAEVVKSKDLRLWEGFPILLANSVEKGLFNCETIKGYLKQPLDELCLVELIVMSLALYEVVGVKFIWTKELYSSFSLEENNYEKMLAYFKAKKDVPVAQWVVSRQRLISNFNNYFKREERAKIMEFASLREEFDLDYALSQLFSAKQKELFFKKLRGEKMSKTEGEYYSRVVKKKVLALANAELHKLAQKIK